MGNIFVFRIEENLSKYPNALCLKLKWEGKKFIIITSSDITVCQVSLKYKVVMSTAVLSSKASKSFSWL
jgi:hypothetical protein